MFVLLQEVVKRPPCFFTIIDNMSFFMGIRLNTRNWIPVMDSRLFKENVTFTFAFLQILDNTLLFTGIRLNTWNLILVMESCLSLKWMLHYTTIMQKKSTNVSSPLRNVRWIKNVFFGHTWFCRFKFVCNHLCTDNSAQAVQLLRQMMTLDCQQLN